MEVNPFRGEREIESRWGKEDYEIMRQVTNGPSSYETKHSSGRVKVPHRDGFSRVATPKVYPQPCVKTGHTGECTAWGRSVRMDAILKWNEIGRDGMLPPLFPAKRVA